MADLTISSDTSFAAQAYDIAQQNTATQNQKSGKNVVGNAQTAAQATATLGAAAPTATDAVGGTTSAGNQAKAVTTNTDAPSLPDPTGATASPTAALKVVKGSEVFGNGGDNIFAALQEMTKADQQNINVAMLVKRDQGANQVGAAQKDMQDKQTEIAGSQTSAITKFAGSMISVPLGGLAARSGFKMETAGSAEKTAASTTAKAAGAAGTAEAQAQKAADTAAQAPAQQGSKTASHQQAAVQEAVKRKAVTDGPSASTNAAGVAKKQKTDAEKTGTDPQNAATSSSATATDGPDKERQAKGAGYRAMSQYLSPLLDSGVSMLDQTVGGQNQAYQAQVAQKQDAVQKQIFQNNTDSAGSWLDSAKEQRKSAQEALVTHITSWGAAINRVWGG